MAGLTPQTFLAVAEMIFGHLRSKESDRWTPHVCRLKFSSFTSEFPEVSETQFMWAAEQWIQNCGAGFVRFPTWRELMAPLYRTENGLANRSWGFNPALPQFLAPTPEQLAMLPARRASIAGVADQHNAAAYDLFTADHPPILPAAKDEASGLTDELWQGYLEECRARIAEQEGAGGDPGKGAEGGVLVRPGLQPTRRDANPAKRRVPASTPAV